MANQQPDEPLTIMRLPAVIAMTGLVKTTIDDLEKLGLFPKRIALCPGVGRSVGWLKAEVEQYIRDCVAASRAADESSGHPDQSLQSAPPPHDDPGGRPMPPRRSTQASPLQAG